MDRRLLAVAGIAVAFGCTALYTGPVFRAALMADLGWSTSLAAGAFAIGYVAAGLTPILGGMAADRLGAPRVLVAGLLLAGTGLLGSAFTQVPWHWYVTSGVMLGVAYYLIHIAATLTATGGHARGTAVGVAIGLGCGVGVGGGPVLAQLAIDAEGWRGALGLFGAAALAGAVGIALATAYIRRTTRPPNDASTTPGPTERETSASSPRRRLIAGFFVGNAILAVFDETVYQYGLGHALTIGLDPHRAAALIGVISIGLMAGMLLGGPLSDVIGRQLVLIGAALTAAIGVLGFASAAPSTIWTWGGLFGIGLGASLAVRSAAWGDAFQGSGRGRAIGMVATGYPLGAALTVWLEALWLDDGGRFEMLAMVAATAAVSWALLGGLLTAPARRHERPALTAPASRRARVPASG